MKKFRFFKMLLISLHIVFAIIGFYTYFFNYQLSQTLLLQKTQSKQTILAKAGASSIENLLKNVQNQLSSFTFSFAKINDDAPIDKDSTRGEFVGYMQRSQLPINGIALFDEYGKLAIIENRMHLRVGEDQDFSKAEFVKWSKSPENRDRSLVSGPYVGTAGASSGKIILIVAKPVYFGTRFRGTLIVRILVDDLRKTFIAPLASDAEEDSFIVNSQGVLVAGKNQLLNKNLLLYAQSKKWNGYKEFLAGFTQAIKNDRTLSTWVFQNPNEQPKNLLVVVSKIDLPNTDKDLFLVVSTPKNDILAALTPLRLYGIAWLGFGVLTTIIGSLIVLLLPTLE